MKNQEIKGTSTLGLLFYESMKVFQSLVEYLRDMNSDLNHFLILCMFALIFHSFQMLDPVVLLHFLFKVFHI